MSKFDRLVQSKLALGAAFFWGLAEATFFFIVPDVFLTMLGCRSVRAALRGVWASLLGALVGGVIMYNVGLYAPVAARAWLDSVPAISPAMVASVQAQTEANGLAAALLGPTRGTPYKIYAVEWGARGGNLLAFLLVSIPARGVRFVLSALLAAGLARLLSPWTQRAAASEVVILGVGWAVFYGFYFAMLGW